MSTTADSLTGRSDGFYIHLRGDRPYLTGSIMTIGDELEIGVDSRIQGFCRRKGEEIDDEFKEKIEGFRSFALVDDYCHRHDEKFNVKKFVRTILSEHRDERWAPCKGFKFQYDGVFIDNCHVYGDEDNFLVKRYEFNLKCITDYTGTLKTSDVKSRDHTFYITIKKEGVEFYIYSMSFIYPHKILVKGDFAAELREFLANITMTYIGKYGSWFDGDGVFNELIESMK